MDILYWVYNDRRGVDIKYGQRGILVCSLIEPDGDKLVAHIDELKDTWGSEGCFGMVQKYLKRYVPADFAVRHHITF